jgi:hypothetical protein
MTIQLPTAIREWLIARYLADPSPDKADFGTGTPEPHVCVSLADVSEMLQREGVPILPTLDQWHDAGIIADMMTVDAAGIRRRWVAIRKTIFGTVATDPPAQGDDAGAILDKTMRAIDPLNRDVLRIVSDDTKGAKAKGIELLNLDPRFHAMTAAEFGEILGAKNIRKWFNTERAKAAMRWRERADRLD